MKLLRSVGGALSIALLLGMVMSSVAVGQTLTALNFERSIALNNVLTTITPTIPPNLLAAIAGGALDVREQTAYNPQQNALTSTVFVVPTGAPNPTNLAQIPAASVVAIVGISVANIAITSKPVPAVQITGPISQSTVTPYGSYIGGSGTFSFGYTTDTTPKINKVIETVAGTIVIYSPSSSGTFTIVNPANPIVNPNPGVAIVVNGSTSATPSFSTTLNQIILDASASKSTNPGALTYSWTATSGSASISFPNGNQSIANVQLGSGKITYVITLKVTDSTGASSTVTITINYF